MRGKPSLVLCRLTTLRSGVQDASQAQALLDALMGLFDIITQRHAEPLLQQGDQGAFREIREWKTDKQKAEEYPDCRPLSRELTERVPCSVVPTSARSIIWASLKS